MSRGAKIVAIDRENPELLVSLTREQEKGVSIRTYTEADRESAYFLWRTVGRRNLAATSRALGIPYGTLDTWKQDDLWVEAADRDDKEAVGVAMGAIQLAIAAQALPSVMTAVELRDDVGVSPKVRLDAAQWLAGLAGLTPVARQEVMRKGAFSGSSDSWENLSDAELGNRLSAVLASEV